MKKADPYLNPTYDPLIYADSEVHLLEDRLARARNIRIELVTELVDNGDATISGLARLIGMRRETLSVLIKEHRAAVKEKTG